MKTKHVSTAKALLVIAPALLLALVLRPAVALAWASVDVTFKAEDNGTVTPIEPLSLYLNKSACAGTFPDWATEPQTGDFIDVTPEGAISPTAIPATGYKLDYWTADTDVYLNFENWEDTYWVYRVAEGTHLDEKQISKVYVDRATTFTAHFVKDSDDSDVDPVDPVDPVTPDTKTDTDDSTTVKPADTSSKKALPKTGNASTGAAALLCAGGIIVAGVAIARKCFC